jgi:hypothetical protein
MVNIALARLLLQCVDYNSSNSSSGTLFLIEELLLIGYKLRPCDESSRRRRRRRREPGRDIT